MVNKKKKSRKSPKPRKEGFPSFNVRIGDLYYKVTSDDCEEEEIKYYHQQNIENGFLRLIPHYLEQTNEDSFAFDANWKDTIYEKYHKELDLTPLTHFQDIRSLELSQMGYIKDFSPLQQLHNLETLVIDYDWEWHEDLLGGESFKHPYYNFSTLPSLKHLKKFEYQLLIQDTYILENFVQSMPNLESIVLTISSGSRPIPDEYSDEEIYPEDYYDDVDLSTLLNLKKLRHLQIVFANCIGEENYYFFRDLGKAEIPLQTLKIIERNWYSNTIIQSDRYNVLDDLFEISKIKTLEELYLHLEDPRHASWEVFPTGTEKNNFKTFGLDFLKALSTLPNLKKLDGNWMAWFEKHKWKDLNEKNQMKSLRYEAIKQCTRLEEVDELPEIKDNSIFKKLTSLKKINGNVIITNCTNLKETCNYLQNIDIGNLHLTIQDKTAVDFKELSRLISIRNKSGLYQLTVIFPFKQLTSLQGIEKLRRLSHLSIWGLGDNIDLGPLHNLTKLEEVILTGSLFKNSTKILNQYNSGMLTFLKNYPRYDYKTQKYKMTNAIKIKDYSKDEYRFKQPVETQQEEEKMSWEFLGECYLPEGPPLGVIDPKHLPLDSKLFDPNEHEWDEIERYFEKHGAGGIGFQDNVIYAKVDQFNNIKELRILEGGSMDIGRQYDAPVVYGRLDIYSNYYSVEKGFYDSYGDKNALEENRFKIISEKISSFEIKSNKMILFDHKDYAINTNYANLLKQQPKNNKLVLYKDHEDKFRSGVIPNVVKIEDWYPNYLINCDNGIYDVFSIQGYLQRKKLKAKDVKIKFSCCSQTKTFHKDLIVQKKYGAKKGNPVDYFYCDKCDKLIGGFNEEIRDMLFDNTGEKINFNEYSLEGYNYQPYRNNFFCYVIRLRENNNQDIKLDLESHFFKKYL